jgi:hypothetical protein
LEPRLKNPDKGKRHGLQLFAGGESLTVYSVPIGQFDIQSAQPSHAKLKGTTGKASVR